MFCQECTVTIANMMIQQTADVLIRVLGLEGHIEGGYFREVYRSPFQVDTSGDEERALSTVIYFLLRSGQFSAFHRLRSDELWLYHCGCPLRVYQMLPDGGCTSALMGHDVASGQQLQVLFPAGAYFAAEPAEEGAFALVSCVVSPGFDYRDFELASAEELLRMFPGEEALIHRLCCK